MFASNVLILNLKLKPKI